MPPEPARRAGYLYCVYGLTISVPFPCPALQPAEPGNGPDVVVTEGRVARAIRSRVCGEPAWDGAPGRFLFRGGPRSGRFLVADGQVVLERNCDANDLTLARHFTDRVLAAVLRQRGMLVLHASSVLTSTGAVAIAGDSGAGKSTTLARLLEDGCAMLSDDITALRMDARGRVEVVPGCGQMHLTEDAADGLGVDTAGVPLQPWRRMKLAMPTLHRMAEGPAVLRSIVSLTTHAGDDLQVEVLSGAAKFNAVQESIYGPVFPEEHPDLFPLAATVASVDVFAVRRPAHRWSAAETAAAVLATTGGAAR